MKKKWLCLLLLSLLCVSVPCSCTKKQKEPEETDAAERLPDVVFPKDQFFVHLYGSATENDADKPEEDADQTIQKFIEQALKKKEAA